jgi:hypothetical protein
MRFINTVTYPATLFLTRFEGIIVTSVVTFLFSWKSVVNFWKYFSTRTAHKQC